MSMFSWLGKKNIGDSHEKHVLGNQITTDYKDGAFQLENAVNDFIINFDWTADSQADLINQYREIATHADVDYAIEDIINEMVSFSEDDEPVKLNLDNVESLADKTKERVQESFNKVCKLLALRETIHQKARSFYIDGRLAYQKVVDKQQAKKGLLGVIELDAKCIKKYRNIQYDEHNMTIADIKEFFIYDEKKKFTDGSTTTTSVGQTRQFKSALKLARESITYITSGMVDNKTGMAIGWLHKAIRPANQLRMMENALIIYRITRAPERRVFYVDTGNLPKSKAEQYLSNLKSAYRNRMSYDPENGSFKDNRHLNTMQEDFWLPRSGNGKGTEVSTLSGGANLGDIEDVVYFLKRLYKSLNVPVSRLEQDAMASLGGRATEINRDELKFSKFVSKIRKRFNLMFKDLLKTDLILTNILTAQEWDEIEQEIEFIYAQDMYIEERKFFEMTRDRIELAKDLEPFIGKYVSHDYVRSEILRQTDEDKKMNDDQMTKELSDPKFKVDDETQSNF